MAPVMEEHDKPTSVNGGLVLHGGCAAASDSKIGLRVILAGWSVMFAMMQSS